MASKQTYYASTSLKYNGMFLSPTAAAAMVVVALVAQAEVAVAALASFLGTTASTSQESGACVKSASSRRSRAPVKFSFTWIPASSLPWLCQMVLAASSAAASIHYRKKEKTFCSLPIR